MKLNLTQTQLGRSLSRPRHCFDLRATALSLPRSIPRARLLSTPASYSSTILSPAPTFFNSVQVPQSDGGAAYPQIPAFRALDAEGALLPSLEVEWRAKVEAIPEETLKKIYETMTLLPGLDNVLSSSQRQGRISFYMTSHGEEGAVVGSAAAWAPDDEVFAQYREAGVLLYRGYSMDKLMAQVFSSASDTATKGRQMPVHYSSPEHHFHTISSPLATQIPQAAGAAYALKMTPGREKSCVVCYMGEGAASEGDFHAGLNMAAVLGGPCIFFVRNNGFAISTPTAEQYHGDGIAARGPGYGIETVRVDGNDPLAVYLTCQEARKRAVETQKPILIEALSYRVGHHSTSDDSTAYRSASTSPLVSPLARLRAYLSSPRQGSSAPLWTPELESDLKASQRQHILKAFKVAEREKKPRMEEMFKDVFAGGDALERPQREQKAELGRLVRKWGAVAEWKKELDRFEGGKDAVDKW